MICYINPRSRISTWSCAIFLWPTGRWTSRPPCSTALRTPWLLTSTCGCWHPAPERLAAWRTAIDQDPARVHGAVDDPSFVASFGEVGGERLKRVPTGYAADHPDAELLKLKDVTFGRRLSDEEALSPDLPDILAEAFRPAVPVMRLLAEL